MKVRKGLVALAAGAILAVAGAGYSAPVRRYHGENDRQAQVVQTQQDRGESYARRGKQLQRMDYGRRGKAMEQRGHQFSREGERQQRFGAWEERDER